MVTNESIQILPGIHPDVTVIRAVCKFFKADLEPKCRQELRTLSFTDMLLENNANDIFIILTKIKGHINNLISRYVPYIYIYIYTHTHTHI